MRVKYLSGKLTGHIEDLPLIEAQAAIATGFAEQVPDPEPEPVVAEPEPAPVASKSTPKSVVKPQREEPQAP